MTLQQLRYLCEVVRQQLNISRAADALHVSQPGLSRQLQLLERELDVVLFVRYQKRLVRLTDAGRQIVSLAERTLNNAQSIREAAMEYSDPGAGSLIIATTHTQARYALPAVIKRFTTSYPKVRLSLRQGTPTEVSHLVSSGNADFSVATEPIQPSSDMVFLPCYQLQRVVLTPARHPLLKVRQLTLEKLATYPLITYDFAFIGHSKILRAFEEKSITPTIALNAIDADVIKTYVESGLGIAIVPEMAYERGRDRTLRCIDASHLFEPNTIQVGIRKSHYLRGYMYAFIEMFAPHLKQEIVEKAVAEATSRRPVRDDGNIVSRPPGNYPTSSRTL